ncbi:TrkH family potassium uptake protein [Paenibacillus sp. y28]|uniref:TrkH family potassium uptake protein n=1 Tax=Paenibacillus sp. y28 TaxID=3129110 RepID=UPI00301AD70E
MLRYLLNRVKLTPPRVLAAGFLIIIFIGTVLLSLPEAAASGQPLHVIDALFMATSATCVTGLSVVDTSTQFSLFGEIVLLAMVQLGGLGFMTTITWILLAVKKRISLQERLILKESLNQEHMEGILRLIIRVFLYSITFEGAAAVCFALRWSLEMPWGQAVYFGLFHAVSLFNNAGIELLGGLQPYVNDPVINVVSMLLILFGGIGFIVISELIEYPKTRRLSLHSKIVLYMTGLLTVIGAIVIFIFESTNKATLGPLGLDTKLLAALFQSVSLRSGGVNTIDIAGLREATQFFMIIMMFIGSAPGSTGGGIKITTFAILIGALLSMLRGKQDVVLLRYRIPSGDIHRAVMHTMIGVFLLVIAAMLLSVVQDQHFLMLLFEAASAFGTVGLSMGLTAQLTLAGKMIIIAMMFIGRIGLVTLALALQPKPKKELYRYPEGSMIIG